MNKYETSSTLTVMVQDQEIELDCTIEFSIHGRHIPATREDPECWPDLEVHSISTELFPGQFVPVPEEAVTSIEQLDQACWDKWTDVKEDAEADRSDELYERERDRRVEAAAGFAEGSSSPPVSDAP